MGKEIKWIGWNLGTTSLSTSSRLFPNCQILDNKYSAK